MAGEVPDGQSITRMARKYALKEFEPRLGRDLGLKHWDEIVPEGKGISVDAILGPNPNLQGEPFVTFVRDVREVSGGKLRVTFKPIEDNLNHVQIESAVEMTARQFREFLRKLFKENIWRPQ